MDIKAIPTRINETRGNEGDTIHCTWEVQLYNNATNTVITKFNCDLFIEHIKASKIAYNNHLRSRVVEDAAQKGYIISNSDVIIL